MTTLTPPISWLRAAGATLLLALCALAPVLAQGVQTGVLTGRAVSSDGQPLPGVTISLSSPALLGTRQAVSDANGVYALRLLPPGLYRAAFSMSGFKDAARDGVVVTAGGTAVVDATLIASAATAVTVTAELPSPLAAPTVSRTLGKAEVDALPIGRRPVDIAEIAPGLTNLTFNAGQLSIGGAFGYDNVFMVNGVDVNDNVFGTANNLFIEDAIQETTVLTSGISAAYGRFSGGVVNVITKSGSDLFTGSVRQNVSNPSWIAETPRERANGITHASTIGNIFEGTGGGPLLKQRLWFFAAGRFESTSTPGTFAQTGGAYTRQDTNRRGEVKLTGTLRPGHTVEASIIANATRQENSSGISAASLADARTLVTRDLPNRLFAASYNGVLGRSLLGSLRYSRKTQSFTNNGGTSQNITDSPFQTLGASSGVPGGLFYHAPYLDATDPEHRDNAQLAGSLTTLLSPARFGTHDLQVGGERFVATGTGGNSQSSTGYVFVTDYLVAGGRPVVDAAGSPVPVFTPGVSQVWNFQATRGATIDIRTSSLYAQDRWVVTPRLTVELGARLEHVSSEATGNINAVNTTTLLPRLGASYNLGSTQRTVVQATYGHYAGKYSHVLFGANTNVGRPSEVDFVYTGPAGTGSDFAPGFDVRNYTQVVFADVPTANVRMADDIRSPLTREFTLGLGREVGRRADARVSYVWRDTTHVVEDIIDTTTGVTNVPLVGVVANRLLGNSDVPTRRYQALLGHASYRGLPRTTITGDYTVQLRNHGTFVGEAASQPGLPSIYGNYPEIFGPALNRLMPDGRLDGFQRHKLRVSAVHTLPLGRYGAVDIAPIWRVQSGAAYSLSAGMAVPAVQLARNPGYPANDINPFVRETVFFGERGAQFFKGYGVVDLAATWRVRTWRTLEPWFKLELYNALNNQKQIAWDRTVSVDRTSVLDANGIPTNYLKGPRFGQATNDNQFIQPYPGQNGGRAIRFQFGARF